MARPGPSGAGDFADQVRGAMRATHALLAGVGSANSDETKAAGKALARSIRKQFRRTPTIGGSHKVKRRKAGDFLATETSVARHAPSSPGQTPAIQTARTRRSVGQAVVGGVRRVGVAAFEGRLLETIGNRPFMAKALAEAEAEMTDVFVGALQRRGG